MKAVYSHTGLASLFVLLILSLLSLFSFSLFRTSLNNHYVVRNEIAAQKSFYRAQSVASLVADELRNITLQDLSTINDLTNRYTWLTNEQSINLKHVGSLSFWQHLTSKKFPPDAQAIAVLLNTLTSHMPAGSLIMTNDQHIQTCYFTILAMAEVSGSTAIVEMGLRKRFVQ